MNIRKFRTERTMWLIDEDLQRFQRIPLSEAPDHPGWQYTDEWKGFTHIVMRYQPDGWVLVTILRPEGVPGTSWIPPQEIPFALEQGWEIDGKAKTA